MRMYRPKGSRRRWPQSRAGGCLVLVLLLIVVLIILSLMFGGFQKGTKSSGLAGFKGMDAAIMLLPFGSS